MYTIRMIKGTLRIILIIVPTILFRTKFSLIPPLRVTKSRIASGKAIISPKIRDRPQLEAADRFFEEHNVPKIEVNF